MSIKFNYKGVFRTQMIGYNCEYQARKASPTDLKNEEWAKIEHLVPRSKNSGKGTQGGRPPKYDRREILNALFYMTRAGCKSRMLPHDLL
jgi:putative transposase